MLMSCWCSCMCLQKEDELAPLFSGAAWAGTLLWDAAIYLTRHFLAEYKSALSGPANTLRIIELGAGMYVCLVVSYSTRLHA